MRDLLLALILFAGLFGICDPANALAAEANVDLIALAANQSVTVPSPERLAEARKELSDSLASLDKMLQRSGTSREQGWKEYLNWEKLNAIGAGGDLDVQELRTLSSLFVAEFDGLEMPQFTTVREALRRVLLLHQIATQTKTQQQHAVVLERLQEDLKALDTDRSRRAKIGVYVGWLRDYEQSPKLIKAIESRFQHANAHVYLSGELLAKTVDVEVEEHTAIRDVIMGTSIRGNASTRGKIRVGFLPSSQQAKLQLLMSGTITSRNTGRNRGVTIFSSGRTSINAHKTIIFDADGIGLRPAAARCRTSSAITGVCAKSKLVERIARRKAGQQKGKVEGIASRKAERQVERQLDTQTREMVGKFNETYQNEFRKPLLRLGEFPPDFRATTTSDELRVSMRQVGRYQVGAPSPPPKPLGKHDASVALHESMIGNITEPFLGGFTLTDERLVGLLDEMGAEVPDDLKVRRDRWSITFDRRQPIQVSFSDDSLSIWLNLRRLVSRGRPISANLRIAATYKLARTKDGVRLTRDGEVQVTYPGRKRLNTGQIAAARLLRSKFRALFKEKIERAGIELPGRLGDGGTLNLTEFRSGNGWLTVGWKLGKPAAAQAKLNQSPLSVARN